MTSWQIYWLTRLDGITQIFGIVFSVALLVWIIMGGFIIASYLSGPDENTKFVKTIAWKAFFVLLASSVGLFVPTSKEMAAILIIPKITNAVASNEKLTSLPDKVLDLANAWIADLGPEKKP